MAIVIRGRRALPGRALKIGCLGLAILVFGALFAVVEASASTIDGISDQSLPTWDGGFAGSYFAGLFRAQWVGEGHIRYARYVVQWNVMAVGHDVERVELEAWLDDVASMGLTPDLALTSYDGVYPRSPAEYSIRLAQILDLARALGHPLPYVEAWNEPNNQGHLTAPAAALLADVAQSLCGAGYGCTTIAGDFEDAPGLAAYEHAYEQSLDFAPAIWGVHPYRSVEAMSEAPYLDFLHNLPGEGAGAQIWITEIAARRCTDYGGVSREYGEDGQARRAQWLVHTLMRNHPPARAFYYEFLLTDDRQPRCSLAEPEDGALYAPAAPPGVQDVPRAAARVVWGGSEAPGEHGGPLTEGGIAALARSAPPFGLP